jgi:hypothetical protein
MGAFGDAIDQRLEELDVARQKQWNRELIEDGRGGLPFEREGFGVNVSGAWRRLYGQSWGYIRDFGWRAVFRGTEGARD